jgi:hypothetical protein
MSRGEPLGREISLSEQQTGKVLVEFGIPNQNLLFRGHSAIRVIVVRL